MVQLVPILILLFAFAEGILAQQSIGKEIKDRDIEWSDFSGPVDPESRFDAVTNWAITYQFSAPLIRDEKAYVRVTTRIFLRSNSWVKPNKQNPRLLTHERGHFRFGRICAREIVARINATAFDPINYAKEIDSIYWTVIRKYQEIEKQYDKETNHYAETEQQELWNKKLDELLRN